MSNGVKPIFIVGAGYSGTSILYKMLALHPDLAWFSQYSLRGREIPSRFSFPFYKYSNRFLRLVFSHQWAKEESFLKIIPRPGEAHRIWGYVFPREAVLSKEEHIKRLRFVLEAECKNWGKEYIIVKSIRFHNYSATLKEAYPEAKFIHIIRDGRAIALSRRYKGDQKDDFDKYVERARHWVEAVERINAEIGKIDMLELRYEDFCQDIHGYLRKILNFIGLDVGKFPFAKFPKILESTNQKWFKMATQGEIALFGSIQKEMLEKYGYL